MNGEQANPFPLSRQHHFSLFENSVRPFDLVFPSGIPLDDIADIPVPRQGNSGIQRVMSRIQTHQELSGSQDAGLSNNPFDKTLVQSLTQSLSRRDSANSPGACLKKSSSLRLVTASKSLWPIESSPT